MALLCQVTQGLKKTRPMFMEVEVSTPAPVAFMTCFCPGDNRALKDVGRALVLHRRTVMPYVTYSGKRKGASDEKEVQQYASLVGQHCAERILLYRS
ncbi:Arginyl-tRNA--protein transferase 1 [Oryzias melastigma]|uniref:Arginyl-tRNA--protein transferase 1 n=1 Tax=Oryzias melastigma TaxID=30732 RepID=A0A834FC91_ORYME|nr:Arginyl-tRNA--protein transferase 1 [Oryzias melastigma]